MRGAFHLRKPMAEIEPPTVEWPPNKKGDIMRLHQWTTRSQVKLPKKPTNLTKKTPQTLLGHFWREMGWGGGWGLVIIGGFWVKKQGFFCMHPCRLLGSGQQHLGPKKWGR